jgi:hypothetical protein
MTPTSTVRKAESGYAVLLVFAMASIVAIGLYQQLPRAAFEAQREKEQLLIMHGEQYKRGIQLYVRKMGRYPAKIEDLDNTQNIRFLRKHFLDPMTGKDEWRLLHMGPAGKLIDSKIESADANKDQWHQGSITEFKSSASSDGGPENANIATRRRPSDDQNQVGAQGGMMPGSMPPDPTLTASSATPGGTPGTANPNAPAQPAGPPSWLNGGALPGMPPGLRGLAAPQAPQGQAGSANPDPNAGNSASSGVGSSIGGNGGYGSAPSTPTYPTTPGYNQPNASGFGQPGQQTNASNMINNLLTQPRPGGMPNGAGMPGIGGSVVGGLAGVASTYKGRGIIHYNEQEEYIKWEFYYDLGAEQAKAAQNQMNNIMPAQQQPSGQSTFGQPATFQPATGSTFGQPVTPQPTPPPQPAPMSQ